MHRLILARHGETIWNHTGLLQGATDIPLSDAGRVQAIQLAQRFAQTPLDAIYSSDLLRAMLTAQVIANSHTLAVTGDARLRQSSKGLWEGLTWEQIAARFPAEHTAYYADPVQHTPPNGEPFAQIVARITALLDDLARSHPGDETVLLVGHGQVLRMLICIALGLDPARFRMFTLDNAALAELRYGPGGATLYCLNDTTHLPDSPQE